MASDGLLQDVRQHLDLLLQDPSTALDVKLMDEAGYFLGPRLVQQPQEQYALVSQISTVLPRLQQDPSPVTRLLSRLIHGFTFEDILSMHPPVDFVAGLSIAAEAYNSLMITLLGKAAKRPTDTARLANMPAVVKALVTLWLHTPDMSIAEEAIQTLIELLSTDKEATSVGVHGVGDASPTSDAAAKGTGLLWRRCFGDRDIYSLLFEACGQADEHQSSFSAKQRSLAQARVLAFAPHLGELDWSYLARSHHADVEAAEGMDPSKQGLLDFIVGMVDYEDDVVLHVNLIHFFSNLIKVIKEPSHQKHVSISLQFLQDRGHHDRILSHWLGPQEASSDPLDATFLYAPAAHYVSIYVSEYPAALLQDSTNRQAVGGLYSILQRLSKILSISAVQWAQGESPKHDLNVLVSLPRVALLPQTQLGAGRQASPLLIIPCKNTNVDALNSLARVFHGPARSAQSSSGPPEETIPTSDRSDDNPSDDTTAAAEAAAARALYTLYLHNHPTLFTDLTAHANTVALPDKAIAAINLIASIATANWSPLPVSNAYNPAIPPISSAALPDESTLSSFLPATPTITIANPTAQTGISALLQPPARSAVIPFLLKPAQTFSNLAGGRGDSESAAYKVATAKFDCLLAVQKALRASGSGSGEDGADVMAAIDKRVGEGVWGVGGGTEVGGRIATMEL